MSVCMEDIIKFISDCELEGVIIKPINCEEFTVKDIQKMTRIFNEVITEVPPKQTKRTEYDSYGLY